MAEQAKLVTPRKGGSSVVGPSPERESLAPDRSLEENSTEGGEENGSAASGAPQGAEAAGAAGADADSSAPGTARGGAAVRRPKRAAAAITTAVDRSTSSAGAGMNAPPMPDDRRPRKTPRKSEKYAVLDAASATGASMAPPAPPEALPLPTCGVSGAEDLREDSTGGDERGKQRLQRDLEQLREQYAQQKKRLHSAQADRAMLRKALTGFLVQVAQAEDAAERDLVAAAKYQLGPCPRVGRDGKQLLEGGYEAEAVKRWKERIKDDRLAIERQRRQLTKQQQQRRGSNAGGGVAAAAAASAGGDDPGEEGDAVEEADDVDDLWESREICNCRMSFLAREEQAANQREQHLFVEQALHLRRLKRLETAERSTFRNFPLLAEERYQLLNLIGQGGFSAVYRAYDLENNQFCAVKIHELGKDMTDHQCQVYIRRAMREYEIQKMLIHPRVVTLQDCFAISNKAFGTVLELCEGDTLDEYMKRHGPLSERESRGITIQILSGLKYMNTNGRKIIHYDLKPGNLFFYNGEVKIADFGLSKIVHEDAGDTIALTSQGAGTYWYLPPECFVEACSAQEPPKISNKVDVWSVGVIFFELLFNRRPFGHGQSQEALLRATVALNQRFAVEIPAVPKISNDAKDFLKRLLTISRDGRPDVIEAFNDSYLRSRIRPAAPPAMVQGQGEKVGSNGDE